jgi:protein-tyrosine phosphatase
LIESKNREEKLKNRIQDSNFNISDLLNPTVNKSPNNLDTKQSQESMMKASEFKGKNKHQNTDIYNVDVIKQEVQEYQQVFQSLKQQEQTSNISDIVKSFVEIEDKQASLLSFINTLNDEKDLLEKEKKKLLAEID